MTLVLGLGATVVVLLGLKWMLQSCHMMDDAHWFPHYEEDDDEW